MEHKYARLSVPCCQIPTYPTNLSSFVHVRIGEECAVELADRFYPRRRTATHAVMGEFIGADVLKTVICAHMEQNELVHERSVLAVYMGSGFARRGTLPSA